MLSDTDDEEPTMKVQAANKFRAYYYGRNADWFGNQPCPKAFEITVSRHEWAVLDMQLNVN